MKTPWSANVRDRTLVVTLPALYRILSWAPLGGGLVEARTIMNHQVNTKEYETSEPVVFLRELARQLQLDTPVVGLMTGVLMERLVRQTVQRNDVAIECFATVGLSNVLTVGDPATYEEHPGTINIIAVVNQSLSNGALVEAVQIVTEARVHALSSAGVKSVVSERLATGTGTDCIAIACPIGGSAYRYCGKHTSLGELFGRVANEVIAEGLKRASYPA